MQKTLNERQPESAPGAISRSFDPRSKVRFLNGEVAGATPPSLEMKQFVARNSTEAGIQIDISEEKP
jgi:hypothetical protein